MSRGLLTDLREVLKPPVLRRLFLARSISVTGDMMVPVALAFAVLRLTGSATALGLVLASRALPALLLMLFGGAAGDRYPRRLVMVSAQLAAAVSQIAVGVLLLVRVENLALLCALVVVRGATSAFFNPAATAALAAVTDTERRQTACGLFALVGAICEVAGPALAAVLMAFVDPGWVVLLDGLTFIVSAALIRRCGGLGHGQQAGEKVRMRQQIWQGLSYVRRTPWLSTLIASASIYQFSLLSALTVLGPLVAEHSLGGPSAWAAVVAAMGLGGVLGGIAGLRLTPQYPLRIAYLMGALAAGPTLVLLAIPAPLWAIMSSEFCAGAAVTLFGTWESTTISHHTPRGLLSRVDSVNRLGSMALKPIGMALVAPVAAGLGLRTALLVAAALSLAGMVAPLALHDVRNLPAVPDLPAVAVVPAVPVADRESDPAEELLPASGPVRLGPVLTTEPEPLG